jgi:hypothetical protein
MLSALWKAWHSFWFEPKSPLPVAVFRILFGLLVMQSALVHVLPGLMAFYGSHGIVSLETVKYYNWEGHPRFDLLLLLPPGDGWIALFFWLYVAAAFCVTIGLGTPYSTGFVALALISLQNHNPYINNAGDIFLKLVSIFLTFSHAGDALSVDQILKRRAGAANDQALYSPWGQRMIQVQVAIVYLASFLCKISGKQWLDGTAVYYATRLDDMLRFPAPFIFDNIWCCKLLSWYTLVIEFGMWALVWFKRVRYFFLAGVLVLHLGIEMAINLPIFEWAFIAALVTFVEPDDLRNWLTKACNVFNRFLPAGLRLPQKDGITGGANAPCARSQD